MARHGRGFPLGTQFLFTPVEPALRIIGTASFKLTAAGGPHVRLAVSGSATFHLTAAGSITSAQKVKGSALFRLNSGGVISLLAGGGVATQFVGAFSKASEAAAGLVLADENPATHPYLEALAVSLKEMAVQGEPVTIGPIGQLDKLAKFTGPTQVGDSAIAETGGAVSVTGTVSVTGDYKVAGTKVLGARITGYVAMTGTPNRGTAYASGTITLIQLAERVKALQDDFMTHGAIGT